MLVSTVAQYVHSTLIIF